MSCTTCNHFQGRWKIDSWDDSDPATKRKRGSNRNHLAPRFTWPELQNSASSCFFCGILERGCRGCFAQHSIQESEILTGSLRFIYPNYTADVEEADADKILTFTLKNGRRFEVEMFATEDDDCPIPESWDYMAVSSRTSPKTDSAEALVTIKDWISECVITHSADTCHSPERPCLPTRVLDVGLETGTVRLIESKGARADYICLSHCWGLTQIITTTTSTIEERKRSISWEDLSKTFQEAISLTRTLGFQYIWIDSLCIIQDDSQDWEIESAKMTSVYSNGHLTIAATHSANGHGGLFASTLDVPVFGKTPQGEDYGLYFRERIDHHIEMTHSLEFVSDGIKDMLQGNPTAVYFPLLTRAWVYQERMLSIRVLHFGRYEMFFECKTSIKCECDGIQYHGSGIASPVPVLKIEYADALENYHDLHEKEDSAEIQYHGARMWRTIVCSYTALRLTKSKDRLPAIGGLAKQLAAVRKSKYLAGLWEETLNDDLLWTVYTTSTHKKPRSYPRNAPTWSWASVETWVSYWDEILFTDVENVSYTERPPYSHFAKIETCDITQLTLHEFGAVEQGLLEISGLVVEGVLEREVAMDDGIERIDHYVSFANTSTRLPIKTDYLLDYDNGGRTSPMTPVFCLRMSVVQEGRIERLISLVLKRSPEIHNYFERIGTLLISGTLGAVKPEGIVFENATLQTVFII